MGGDTEWKPNVLAHIDEDDILDKVKNTVISEEKKTTMVRGMPQTS